MRYDCPVTSRPRPKRGRSPLLVAIVLVVLAGFGSSCSREESGQSRSDPTTTTTAGLPRPDEPISRDPARLARVLEQTTADLHASIDAWTGESTSRGGPPSEVTLLALYQQRIYLLLGGRPRLARATLARLSTRQRGEARDILAARRALGRLSPPTSRTRFRTGSALPAGLLRRFYEQAQRRFGVDWRVLAAVNFIETGFNRLRNNSTAGAQGPMQFIPSTWRAYGLGGNIRDPRDAILGAANYLRASGAPRDYRRALYAYNPSSLYVRAVLRYARRMRRDARNYYAFYSWQVFVRTPSGSKRLTGPRPR